MNILHGTWIPDSVSTPEANFVRSGSFCLWIETEKVRRWKTTARHNRQLTHEEMVTALREYLGFTGSDRTIQVQIQHHSVQRYFWLPSAENQPLPSLELARYLDEELPDSFQWQCWQVDCLEVPLVASKFSVLKGLLPLLSDLHFFAYHGLADLQIGADLLFWFHYLQGFKSILLKDQYIPALKYREIEPEATSTNSKTKAQAKSTSAKSSATKSSTKAATTTRAKTTTTKTIKVTAEVVDDSTPTTKSRTKSSSSSPPSAKSFCIYPGWEILSPVYEANLQQYLPSMPLICCAGFPEATSQPTLHDRLTLLRHFSEYFLDQLIRTVTLPQTFSKRLETSLIQDCLHATPQPWITNTRQEQYLQWQAWRDRLDRRQANTGFTLGFQLQEPATPEGNWQVLFVVISRQDPSLRYTLQDFWRLRSRQKAQLERQFGQDFELNLLINLGHAARIYPPLWQGLETDQPVGISIDLVTAFEFLKETAWILEDAGYKVIIPAWWTPQGQQRARIKLRAKSKSKSAGKTENKGYFALETLVAYDYELAIGDESVSEQEWQQLVKAKAPLVQFRGQWVELNPEKMQQMLAFWQTHQQENPNISLIDLMKLSAEADDTLEIDHDEALREMIDKLRDASQLEPVTNLPGLQGTLREYQQRGVAWLNYLETLGLNGCLADDMGLGKTVQVIARLVQERSPTPPDSKSKTSAKTSAKAPSQLLPTLLIAPTSVVGNWLREIRKFAPHLTAYVHHGSQRAQEAAAFKALCHDHDVIITSFTLIRKDAKLFDGITWQRIVLDEAQNIKNPKAAQTKAILKLSANHRLALTGTPVENRLLDLWSIFNFLNPGYLGKESQFRTHFEVPIQRNNEKRQSTVLKKLVEPFILRRVKTDKSIIKDLPDKVEQKVYCNLTKEQASLYEATVRDIERQLKEADGIQRKGLILSSLMKLKQICNHPRQFLQDDSEFSPERSHKLSRLLEMLEEVIQAGESLLIFSQFTEIGDALDRYLRQICCYRTFFLHGGTSQPKREQMIQDFQNSDTEPAVFVLSLKAGGVGITLTKANHVFHFDRWWNPAVEDQATDRAFRIGQQKNVFVHKFVATGTLEERIDEMIEDKKKLAGSIVGADESWLTELDNESFKQLIALNKSSILD